MISHELRSKAINLRKSGASYTEISNITGVAVGMLSYWFSKEKWSKDIVEQNREKSMEKSRNRMLSINMQRSKDLQEKYRLIEDTAIVQFEKFKTEPLFVGALMLYLGEGDKSSTNPSVRISNIDYSVLKIFIRFVIQYCDQPIEKIRLWVLCYPDLDIKTCESWWLERLDLTPANLYKAQVIAGKHRTKRLRYGVGNIILQGKSTKVMILKWIELMSKELR